MQLNNILRFLRKKVLLVGWETVKKRLIKEVEIHHKKDRFFLQNFFIWCLKVPSVTPGGESELPYSTV